MSVSRGLTVEWTDTETPTSHAIRLQDGIGPKKGREKNIGFSLPLDIMEPFPLYLWKGLNYISPFFHTLIFTFTDAHFWICLDSSQVGLDIASLLYVTNYQRAWWWEPVKIMVRVGLGIRMCYNQPLQIYPPTYSFCLAVTPVYFHIFGYRRVRPAMAQVGAYVRSDQSLSTLVETSLKPTRTFEFAD